MSKRWTHLLIVTLAVLAFTVTSTHAPSAGGITMQVKHSTSNMVMSVLEAHVAEEHWSRLREVYEEAVQELPAQLMQTYMVQSEEDPTRWRIMSIWQSREALEEYRRSVEVPGGVLIFRSVNAEPTLSIFEVAISRANVEPTALQP